MPRGTRVLTGLILGVILGIVSACSQSDIDEVIASLSPADKSWVRDALLHDGLIRKHDGTAEVAVTGHYAPRHIEILNKVAVELGEVLGSPVLELGEAKPVTPKPPENWPEPDKVGLLIVSPVPFSIQIMNYLTVIETHLKNRFHASYKMQTTVNHLLRKPIQTCRGEIDLRSDGQPFILVMDNSTLFEGTEDSEAILARCAVELYLGVLGWDISRARPYPDGLNSAAVNQALGRYLAGESGLPLSSKAMAALRILYSDQLENGDDATRLDEVLGP